jgi:hypothetical protein
MAGPHRAWESIKGLDRVSHPDDPKEFDPSKYEGWQHMDFGYWVRLYWQPVAGRNGERGGFEAACFEAESCTGVESGPFDAESGTIANKVFEASALFDGIRHLTFCGEIPMTNEAYFYYPELDVFIGVFEQLKKLVAEHCSTETA